MQVRTFNPSDTTLAEILFDYSKHFGKALQSLGEETIQKEMATSANTAPDNM